MEETLARRCTATARSTGEQCGRAPIPGGHVCINHGGGAPQTVAAARLRLLEAVEPAVVRLLRFIEAPPGLCDACGRCDDTSAIVSAIRTVLDRSGLGPSASLAVTAAAPTAPWVEWMTVEHLRLMGGVIEDAKRRMDAGEPRPPQCVSRIVDGATGEEWEKDRRLEAGLVEREMGRPVIREIVHTIVDPPKWD